MALTTEDLTAISNLIESKFDDNFAKQAEQIKIQFEMQDTKIDTRFFIQDARYETLTNKVNERLEAVDARLEGVDTRLESIDLRLDGIDLRLDGIDTRLDEGKRIISYRISK